VNDQYKQWMMQGIDSYQFEVTRGGHLPIAILVNRDKVVNGA